MKPERLTVLAITASLFMGVYAMPLSATDQYRGYGSFRPLGPDEMKPPAQASQPMPSYQQPQRPAFVSTQPVIGAGSQDARQFTGDGPLHQVTPPGVIQQGYNFRKLPDSPVMRDPQPPVYQPPTHTQGSWQQPEPLPGSQQPQGQLPGGWQPGAYQAMPPGDSQGSASGSWQPGAYQAMPPGDSQGNASGSWQPGAYQAMPPGDSQGSASGSWQPGAYQAMPPASQGRSSGNWQPGAYQPMPPAPVFRPLDADSKRGSEQRPLTQRPRIFSNTIQEQSPFGVPQAQPGFRPHDYR
ncbi:MAG: hypothetical protein ABW078_05475 [Sedimenticola sp.]